MGWQQINCHVMCTDAAFLHVILLLPITHLLSSLFVIVIHILNVVISIIDAIPCSCQHREHGGDEDDDDDGEEEVYYIESIVSAYIRKFTYRLMMGVSEAYERLWNLVSGALDLAACAESRSKNSTTSRMRALWQSQSFLLARNESCGKQTSYCEFDSRTVVYRCWRD